MTTTSQVPAVTDWLFAAAQSSALLGQASPQVYVFDGPQVPAQTQSLERVLWIGCDPAASDSVTATATQAWPNIDHARTRDEDGDIVCAAQHWNGASNKVNRNGAAAIVAGVELLLRGVPGDGGPGDATMGGLALWSSVDGPFDWTPRTIGGGTACLVTFRVSYRARLTTS